MTPPDGTANWIPSLNTEKRSEVLPSGAFYFADAFGQVDINIPAISCKYFHSKIVPSLLDCNRQMFTANTLADGGLILGELGMAEFDLIPVEEFKKDREASRYAEERESMAKSSVLDKYREEFEQKIEDEFEQARQDDNFWNILETPQDRVKADQNKDGKVNYDEYREYILSQDQATQIVQQPANPPVQQTYHLDYSFYIVVGMICLTVITVMWLKKK